MSHRDVNVRRILSCSGRVRCSPQSPGVKGSGGFLQRLASAWCASRSGWQSVGMLGAVEDGLTDSVPPFPPSFLLLLLSFLAPRVWLSAQHTATGWKMSRLGMSNGVFSLQRRDGGGGGAEKEEVEWW